MVKTYLDSCVLIAAVMGNHKLFQKALDIIDDPNREFIFSDFVKFEVLPKATFEKKNDEEREFTLECGKGSYLQR